MDANLIGNISGPGKLIEYKPLVKKEPVAGENAPLIKDGLSGSVAKEEAKDPRKLFENPIVVIDEKNFVPTEELIGANNQLNFEFKDNPMAKAVKNAGIATGIFIEDPMVFFGALNGPSNLGDGIVGLSGQKIANNPTTLQME